MLMPRDKAMLIHMEQYAMSITQAYKIFFKGSQYGYDYARKRLRFLNKNGFIKYYTDMATNQRVYYTNKQLSSHDLMIMDVYANLVYFGAEILEFKKEPQFMDGKIRPDGFFKFKFGGKTRIMLLEVDLSHKSDLKRYEALYESEELQEKYKAFPLILVVTEFPDRYQSEKIIFKYINYKQTDIAEKVLLVS